MRRLQQLLFIIVLTSLLAGCEKGNRRTENTLDYIPKNTESVVKIANLETTRNDFGSTHLFRQLNEAGLYDLFEKEDPFLSRLNRSSKNRC